MRRIIMFLFITGVTGLALFLTVQYDQAVPNQILQYYATQAFQDTGARNVVTAIYLNYRVYDTLFEALMLLISVLAIIYFSRHEDYDYEL